MLNPHTPPFRSFKGVGPELELLDDQPTLNCREGDDARLEHAVSYAHAADDLRTVGEEPVNGERQTPFAG